MKFSKKVFLAFGGIIIIALMFLGMGIGSYDEPTEIDTATNLSESVERYRNLVSSMAEEFGMEDYVDLILCVMELESHGNGLDPMQASEGPFNKRYPKIPNGIQDPKYSIECGIQEIKSVLKKAGVANPEDHERIQVALAGYNFGSGYIDWVAQRGNKWTLENAMEFSEIMAEKMGWQVYGDPYYVEKVMGYYLQIGEGITGKDDFLVPLKDYVITSDYGPRGLDGYHYGIDLDAGYGANIYAPAEGKVVAVSNSCPASGGYIGNGCPYNEYMGGGNYVMLEVSYKKDKYYIMICHMKRAVVSNGQTVKKGQKIGEQGHSGNSSGSHAHIEVHKNTMGVGTMKGIVDPNSIMNFKE